MNKEKLNPRGIRLMDKVWKRLNADAKKQKGTASDVVREIIDRHYEGVKR